MAFEHYIQAGGKRLRCGYTTGTCAALAAAGAARLLLGGEAPALLRLVTPKGLTVEVEPDFCAQSGEAARCGVRKDAGDDIDVTAGALICAEVRKTALPGIRIDGGEGVGRVTKPGLDQPVGAAAINHVPRKMIAEAVEAVCKGFGYQGGIQVLIAVPDGEAIAARTFNPNLGIVGGISILGTSGIVEPMSVQALVETTALEMRQAAAAGADRIILTPGSYGMDFLRQNGMNGGVPVVKCSNFIGDALDEAAVLGFREVLLVGHIGKLSKLAGGVMNTHSRWADCRTELFCAHGAVCGAGTVTCRELMDAAATTACLDILDKAGLLEQVMESLLTAIQKHLDRRAAGAYRIGAVLFSNERGLLGETSRAQEIIERWKE